MTPDELRLLAASKRRVAAVRSDAAADLVAVARSCGGCLDALPSLSRRAWKGTGANAFLGALDERRRLADRALADVRSAGAALLAQARDLVDEARRLEMAAQSLEAATIAVPT